jgi:hypothetical protein
MGFFGGGNLLSDHRVQRGGGDLFKGMGDHVSRVAGNVFGFGGDDAAAGGGQAGRWGKPRDGVREREAEGGAKLLEGLGGGAIVVGGRSPVRDILARENEGVGGGGGVTKGGKKEQEGGLWGDDRAGGGRGKVEMGGFDKREYARELMEQAKQAQERRDAEKKARMRGDCSFSCTQSDFVCMCKDITHVFGC